MRASVVLLAPVLIHGAGARGDLAVERNARARLDTDDGVKGHFSGCNGQPGAVGLAHFGGVGRQVQQALDGVARSVHGTRLDQLCNGIERHHHGGFGPLADQEGAGHGHRHQGIDVQASLAQGGKALGVGRKARQPDGRCRKGHARELEHHRVGHKEGKQFRDHRQHQGQTQPPQSFGRSGVCVDVRAAGSKRLGIKAGSADSPQGLRQHGGRRMDRQGSRAQLEIEALHARHPSQGVANLAFLCGAVHGGNAKDCATGSIWRCPGSPEASTWGGVMDFSCIVVLETL